MSDKALTQGVNHLGLAVADLNASVNFFVDVLGWVESGRDESYPRSAVSDSVVRLTLWQVDHSKPVVAFDRRQNIGLHHVALQVESEDQLNHIAERVAAVSAVKIEFMPELVGDGPRKHMMCREPGGVRVEFIWPGT